MATRRPRLMLSHEKRARGRGFTAIAGIDEAGRGPLAGPVVASAVILTDLEFTHKIDDSKKLSPVKRELAYQEIITKAIVGIGTAGEDIIDRINIRKATILAMENAVANLGVDPDYLLIDGRLELDLPHKQKSIIRGDSASLSIAAASIVAKVTRDRIMSSYHKLYPGYRFDLHKGYGTKSHIMRIKRFGLSPIHRRTFKLKNS